MQPPPIPLTFGFFFFLIFVDFCYRAVYDLSVSRNHLAGNSKGKKKGTPNALTMTASTWTLPATKPVDLRQTSSVDLVYTSVLVRACIVWFLDAHRL